MTVHSAKGLEFDACSSPASRKACSRTRTRCPTPTALEEERRLMYVAITRARQRLYLSFSQTRMLHGQTRYNVKSRFFDELPEDALKWLTPRQPGFGSGYAREYQDGLAARQRPGLDRRRRPRRAGDAGLRRRADAASAAAARACARGSACSTPSSAKA